MWVSEEGKLETEVAAGPNDPESTLGQMCIDRVSRTPVVPEKRHNFPKMSLIWDMREAEMDLSHLGSVLSGYCCNHTANEYYAQR